MKKKKLIVLAATCAMTIFCLSTGCTPQSKYCGTWEAVESEEITQVLCPDGTAFLETEAEIIEVPWFEEGENAIIAENEAWINAEGELVIEVDAGRTVWKKISNACEPKEPGMKSPYYGTWITYSYHVSGFGEVTRDDVEELGEDWSTYTSTLVLAPNGEGSIGMDHDASYVPITWTENENGIVIDGYDFELNEDGNLSVDFGSGLTTFKKMSDDCEPLA